MEDTKNKAVELEAKFAEISEAKATEAANAVEVKATEALEATKADFNEKLEKANETNELLQKQIDDAKAEFKTISISKSSKPMNLKGQLSTQLKEKAQELDAFKNKEISGVSIELKDVGYGAADAGVTGTADSHVPLEDRVGDIKFDPHYKRRMRNYVPVGSSSGDSVRYNEQIAPTNGVSGAAATKAHGAAFNNQDTTLSNKSATMQTYGSILTLAEEQLDDVLGLNSYVSSQLMAWTMDLEDRQIIHGDSTGTNFTGLTTGGTDWVDQRAAGAAGITGANIYDVLENAWQQLAVNNFDANCILLNPVQFSELRSLKSTQGEYILRQLQQGFVPTLFGADIVVTPAVNNDSFIMLDKMSTMFWKREGLTVQFERNGNDFANNNISVRSKGRGNMTHFLPKGIVHGTVSTAITELAATQA